MEEGGKKEYTYTKIIATGVLLFFVACIGWFAWKVFSYQRDFKSGSRIPREEYRSTEATSERLAALARNGQGSGELATKDDPSFGPENAPVTIVAFADYGCPYSQQESYALDALARNMEGKVHVIMRDFPLTDLHPGADKAAVAAECASEQGKFEEMYKVLNKSTGEFTDENLLQFANAAGLESDAFTRCMESGFYEAEVAGDIADGLAAGVSSTPTLFINGVKIEGAIPYGILYEATKSLVE